MVLQSSFRSLFGDAPPQAAVTVRQHPALKVLPDTPRKKKPGKPRGCKHCPSNNAPGITKIKGRMRPGRDILLIAQSPGPEENNEGLELIGPSGQLLWNALRKHGIRRRDCNYFNAMKCMPATMTDGSYNQYLKMRNPTQEELHCCSKYSDEHLEKAGARQIVLVGQVAAKAILKTRSVPASKTFWSAELNARIYLLDHPSFFLRGYGKGPRFDQFQATIKRIAEDRNKLDDKQEQTADLSDQYAFIRQQDYRLVVNEKQALAAEKIIRLHAAYGRRIGTDIEADEFEDGQQHVFACSFAPKPGLSFVFVWRHKDVSKENGAAVFAIAQRIIEDGKIKKVLQYGCTDTTSLKKHENVRLRGFTHDTNLSEYLRFTDKKAYGLSAIAEARFPQFSGYKLITVPELMAAALREWQAENPDKPKVPAIFRQDIQKQDSYIQRKKLVHYRHLSLETLRLYNGADAHLCKLIEISNKKHVKPALMRLYIDLSFILLAMEPKGPYFDFEQHEKLAILYPKLEKKLRERAQELAGSKKFNPGSPQQVFKIMYGSRHLGLEYPFDDKPSTKKMALLVLGRDHEFPRVVLEWRRVAKVKSTYLDGYVRSAEAHEGRLRTRWWATGTRTGRLSSGGERNKKDSTIINLQNIKKDPHMQNMCVADKDWKRAAAAIAHIVGGAPEVPAYWHSYERETKKAKKAGRAPEYPDAPKASLEKVYKAIEEWLDEHPDTYTYLMADYGQIEVRVAAQMSGDKNLIADCLKSDIHTTVGVTMTGWDAERIKNDEQTRTLTKNCVAEGQLVLTNYGLVPIEKVAKYMLVWDGLEFVAHDGVICQGVRPVMTYRGLTATPDHEVWVSDGRKVQLQYACAHGLELAITGNQENPVRYPENYFQENLSETGVSLRVGVLKLARANVYDIVNAGPRHRFTVNGVLISNCHFGILFGISKKNLFKFVVAMSPSDMRDRISEAEVSEAYDNYFARYPGIRKLIERQRAFAKEHGYVMTMFGMVQTLNITDDDSEEELIESIDADEMGGKHSYWGNQAINGPVQGTAHQLMICALVNLRRQRKKYKVLGVPPMEIHDALYFRVRVLDLIKSHNLAKYLLEQESLNTVAADFPDIDWRVPIVVEMKSGLRLGTKLKVDENTRIGEFMLQWYKQSIALDEALDTSLLEVA